MGKQNARSTEPSLTILWALHPFAAFAKGGIPHCLPRHAWFFVTNGETSLRAPFSRAAESNLFLPEPTPRERITTEEEWKGLHRQWVADIPCHKADHVQHGLGCFQAVQ